MSLPVYVPPPRLPRRERFAQWRRTRPFWGGLWAIVAGVYLWSLTAAPIGVVVIQGVAGISSIVICLVMVLVAVAVWSQPQLRVIGGGIVIVLGLAAILLSNLGGFIVGTLMALHGGASMIAWKPVVQRWRRPDAAPASAGAVTALVDRMSDDEDATDGPADDAAPVAADATDDDAPDAPDVAPRDPHDIAPPPADADVPASDPGPAAPAAPAGGMSAGMTILPSAPPAGPAPSPADGSGPQASASYSSVIR